MQRDAALRDAVRERRPVYQFQDQRRRAAGFLQTVNGRDVRVIERRQELRFTLEPREAGRDRVRRIRAES